MSTPQPQPIRVTNTHSTNNHHSTMSSTTKPMVQTPQNFHSHPKTSPNNPNVESQQLPSDKAVCGLILKNWKSRHSTKTLIRKAFHVQDFESSIPHDVLMMAAQELSSVVSSSIHDHGNKSGHMISKPHHMMMKHLNKTKQGKQSSRLSSSVGTKLKFHQYQPSQQAFLPPHQESNNLNCQMMVVDSGELTTSSVFVDEFPSSASPSPPYSTNHMHAQSSSTCCNSQMYPPSGMMEPLSSITTTSSTVSKGLSSRSHPGASGGTTTTTTNNTPLIYIEKQVPFKFATLPHQSAPSMKKVLSPPPPTPPSSSNRIVVMHDDDDDDHAESKENQSRRHSPPILNNLNSYSTLEWPLPSNSSRGNHSSNTTTNPDGEAAYNGSFSLPPLLFVHSNNSQNHSERTLPSFSQLINQLGV